MVIPEVLIEYVLRTGISEAKRDKSLVFQLFANTPRNLVEEFFRALTSADLSIVFEFKKTNPSMPCIWVNLMEESEEDPFIGDWAGWSYGADGRTMTDGKTRSYLDVPEGLFYDSSRGESGAVDELGGASLFVGEATALSGGVDPDDVTSPVADPIIGEPAQVFDVAPNEFDRVPVYEKRAIPFRSVYAITILGEGNSTYVTLLYALVKTLFLKYKFVLERNGLLALSMNGTDFMGDPELLPENVFSRSLQISFISFTEIIEELPVPKGIEIAMQPIVNGVELDEIQILNPNISLTSITPVTGARGAAVEVVIAGDNIHIGSTVEIPGDDISLSTPGLIAGGSLKLTITIDAAALVGSRNVTVRNPNGMYDTLVGGFSIT